MGKEKENKEDKKEILDTENRVNVRKVYSSSSFFPSCRFHFLTSWSWWLLVAPGGSRWLLSSLFAIWREEANTRTKTNKQKHRNERKTSTDKWIIFCWETNISDTSFVDSQDYKNRERVCLETFFTEALVWSPLPSAGLQSSECRCVTMLRGCCE